MIPLFVGFADGAARAYRLAPLVFVFVGRPDRIVAWRSDDMLEDPSASLRSVMASVLSLESAQASE